ncbi:cyanophycin synthetase [Nocardioides convexus]|uniref:glutamate ligase domain-containing protein n=1 Tax=Nocardioides convexus TaxID=2712224 RepID=UPI0031011FD5
MRLQRGRPRHRAGWCGTPRWSRAPARSASPSACRGRAWSASSTTSSSTGPSSRSAPPAPPSLCTFDDLASRAPHFVANALAAAALARAHGVSQAAVRDGLRAFQPDGHRIAVVAEHDSITWVDDSKATNPHAAASSLAAFAPVVWVAGGLAKGASLRRPGAPGGGPAAGRRPHRPGPRRDPPGAFATRSGCAGDRRGQHRDWGRCRWRPDGSRRRGSGRGRPGGGHRAAGAGMCVDGPVRRLRRPGRCLRRGGPGPHPALATAGGRHHHREPREGSASVSAPASRSGARAGPAPSRTRWTAR